MSAARALARAALTLTLAASAACGQRDDLDEPADPTAPAPVSVTATLNGTVQLSLPTYDGSGDVVEPDVVHVPGGWGGYQYWMAYNPFPGGNGLFENASIAASRDGIAWEVPAGLHNPVVPLPAGPIIHNSDPDLVYLRQSGRMVLFYRSVTNAQNLLYATTSTDGRTFGPPRLVLAAPNHGLVSPSVALPTGRRAKLFWVDAGRTGCTSRATAVGLRRWTGNLSDAEALVGPRWSAEERTDLNGPPGWLIWHLDVIWVDDRREYWAVFPAYPVGADCNQSDLFMARSRDALHWQVLAAPILRRGDVGWANATLYRSSFEYDTAQREFRVWFSARSSRGDWRIGLETFPVADVLAKFDATP